MGRYNGRFLRSVSSGALIFFLWSGWVFAQVDPKWKEKWEGFIELEAREDLKEDLERIKGLVARLGY